MEQLNSVHIIGIIGSYRIVEIGNTSFARLGVATSRSYDSRSGEIVVETTWHNVVIWGDNRNAPPFEHLAKGVPIDVIGRMRQSRYTGTDGIERSSYEIIAQSASIVDGQLTIENNMSHE